MSRDFSPPVLDARLSGYARRTGPYALDHEHLVITLGLKRLPARLSRAGLPHAFVPSVRAILHDVALTVASEFQPMVVLCTEHGLSIVCPKGPKNTRTYGGRFSALLSGAASVAGASALQAASEHCPAFVAASPREVIQFTGHAFTLPTEELVEDWLIHEEQAHERQFIAALAREVGIDTANRTMPWLRERLMRQSRAWQEAGRTERYGPVVKPLPSPSIGYWDAVDISTVLPPLVQLAEAGTLYRTVGLRYGRATRESLAAGELPVSPGPDPHGAHGRAINGDPEQGPEDCDCACSGGPDERACAQSGCGFCRVAQSRRS